MREKLILTGPMSRAQLSDSVGEEAQLLNLDPLIARAWLGVPISHFTDRRVLLEDIDVDLAGRLSELFFRGEAGKLVRPAGRAPSPYARAAEAAAALRRGSSIAGAASAVGLSDRQLERLFADQFGFSPRRYRRITRFRRAFEAARAGETLASAAASAGYADQPHFTREVRSLTGRSPLALFPHVGNVQDMVLSAREY